MAMQALSKKEPAVVIRYRPSRRYSESRPRYAGVFLSADQLFKLKFELMIRNVFVNVALISPLLSRHGLRAPIFQFVLSSPASDHIHDLEVVLNKPGQIRFLIMQAKTAPTKKAHQDDLSVSIEDWEALDPFADFSAEAEAETSSEPISGHLFFEYTELAHTLLNDVIAGYTRLAFRERKKENPDAEFLAELEVNKALALTLRRQSKTFSSLDHLREVVDDYTPIARALYDSTSSSHLAAS